MKKRNFMLPMHLQFFAEPGEPGAGGGGQDPNPQDPPKPGGGEPGDPGEPNDPPEPKKFSREDLAKMMAAEKAKWQKEQEEKEAERKKLAKMNAEEKAAHERKKLEEQLEEYKRKDQLREMSTEVSKMFEEAGLPHDEGLIDLITTEDAEATKAAVKVVTDFVAKLKKEGARQDPPAAGGKFEPGTSTNEGLAEMAQKHRIIK